VYAGKETPKETSNTIQKSQMAEVKFEKSSQWIIKGEHQE
jgi:hypothetical protein